MMKKLSLQKLIPHLLFIVIPLLIGLLIYIFADNGSFLHDWFTDHFGAMVSQRIYNYLSKSSIIVFLRNFLCDCCWAFSLEHSVYFILRNSRKGLFESVIISIVFSLFIESAQFFGIILGTFDFLDIIFEITAIVFAGFTIYFMFWRNIYEKGGKDY